VRTHDNDLRSMEFPAGRTSRLYGPTLTTDGKGGRKAKERGRS
jgi:hypothetical protein